MPIMRIITNVVNAYVDQTPLPGALKDARLKIRREDFWQEGENLELHSEILPLVIQMRNLFCRVFSAGNVISSLASDQALSYIRDT
jgi:hypothetical protein